MKEKKLTIIASATLAIVLCISAVVFFTSLSQDDLPDCTYKITNKQREMSTYDLLKWFCETDYMNDLYQEYFDAIVSSYDDALSNVTPCNDHQAYYELIRREDLKEAYDKLSASSDERPQTLLVFVFQKEVETLFG